MTACVRGSARTRQVSYSTGNTRGYSPDSVVVYRRAATRAKTEPRPTAAFTAKLPAAPLAAVLEPEGAELEGEPEGVDDEPVALVPLSVMARVWNAVKLRAEVCTGFTANTMPEPQCEAPVGVCCWHWSRKYA